MLKMYNQEKASSSFFLKLNLSYNFPIKIYPYQVGGTKNNNYFSNFWLFSLRIALKTQFSLKFKLFHFLFNLVNFLFLQYSGWKGAKLDQEQIFTNFTSVLYF